MKSYILSAIEEGTSIISSYEYNSEYKNKINNAIQLLLKALEIVEEGD